jgi:hypothetical protein
LLLLLKVRVSGSIYFCPASHAPSGMRSQFWFAQFSNIAMRGGTFSAVLGLAFLILVIALAGMLGTKMPQK